jgi:hypothetical protein
MIAGIALSGYALLFHQGNADASGKEPLQVVYVVAAHVKLIRFFFSLL